MHRRSGLSLKLWSGNIVQLSAVLTCMRLASLISALHKQIDKCLSNIANYHLQGTNVSLDLLCKVTNDLEMNILTRCRISMMTPFDVILLDLSKMGDKVSNDRPIRKITVQDCSCWISFINCLPFWDLMMNDCTAPFTRRQYPSIKSAMFSAMFSDGVVMVKG